MHRIYEMDLAGILLSAFAVFFLIGVIITFYIVLRACRDIPDAKNKPPAKDKFYGDDTPFGVFQDYILMELGGEKHVQYGILPRRLWLVSIDRFNSTISLVVYDRDAPMDVSKTFWCLDGYIDIETGKISMYSTGLEEISWNMCEDVITLNGKELSKVEKPVIEYLFDLFLRERSTCLLSAIDLSKHLEINSILALPDNLQFNLADSLSYTVRGYVNVSSGDYIIWDSGFDNAFQGVFNMNGNIWSAVYTCQEQTVRLALNPFTGFVTYKRLLNSETDTSTCGRCCTSAEFIVKDIYCAHFDTVASESVRGLSSIVNTATNSN